MHLAVNMCCHDFVVLLLDRGAVIDAPDNVCVLCVCFLNAYKNLLLLFFFKSPVPVSVSQSGSTALHYAALKGRLDITLVLLDRGAAIDAADNVLLSYQHTSSTTTTTSTRVMYIFTCPFLARRMVIRLCTPRQLRVA